MKFIRVIFLIVLFISTTNCITREKKDVNELMIKREADSLYKIDEFQAAQLKYSESILKEDSTIGESYYRRGFSLMKLARMDSAFSDIEKAIHYNYRVSEANFLLGVIEYSKGRCETAIIYFNRTLALDPNQEKCKELLQFCLDQRK